MQRRVGRSFVHMINYSLYSRDDTFHGSGHAKALCILIIRNSNLFSFLVVDIRIAMKKNKIRKPRGKKNCFSFVYRRHSGTHVYEIRSKL